MVRSTKYESSRYAPHRISYFFPLWHKCLSNKLPKTFRDFPSLNLGDKFCIQTKSQEKLQVRIFCSLCYCIRNTKKNKSDGMEECIARNICSLFLYTGNFDLTYFKVFFSFLRCAVRSAFCSREFTSTFSSTNFLTKD